MRIAVPLSGGVFSHHFGQSTAFWVCDVQPNSTAVGEGKEIAIPECGGCGAIPGVLAEAGVNLVIAGGMGAGAVQNLSRFGIEVITGIAGGTPKQIVQEYVAGQLASTGQLCKQHEEHHGDGHEGGCHHHG